MTEKKPSSPDKVEFQYRKSNYCRVIHVDGAWGGVSPNAGIHMSVFSETPAIPEKIVHELSGNKLGKEIERLGGTEIVRELEATLLMNLDIAIIIRDWLNDKINMAQQALKQLDQSRKIGQ